MNTNGITIINHRIRLKLGLTMEEYAMLDFIHNKCFLQNKDFTFERIERYTGLDKDQAAKVIYELNARGMIYKKEGKIHVSNQWAEKHGQETDDAFEIFWQKEENKSWPGSKKVAKTLFMKLLDLGITTEFLIARKRAYFDYLRQPEASYRQTMMATVFLNEKTERYNEPWEDYTAELKGKRNGWPTEVTNSNITLEAKEHLFDK